MPHFLLRSTDGKNAFGVVKKDGRLGWSHAKNASVFDTAEQARSAGVEAARTTYGKAMETLRMYEACLEKRESDEPGHVRSWPTPRQFLATGWEGLAKIKDHKAFENAPNGPASRHYEFGLDAAGALFRVDSKSTLEDILQSFETFYARSAHGWLGGPRTKQRWGLFEWRESFTDAQGLPSLDSIKDALTAIGSGSDHTILRTRAVFTEAVPVGNSHDDVSLGIGAACQARDIESTIVEAAKSRLDDMNAAAPDKPAATKARL